MVGAGASGEESAGSSAGALSPSSRGMGSWLAGAGWLVGAGSSMDSTGRSPSSSSGTMGQTGTVV
jgi:hypothetical protein